MLRHMGRARQSPASVSKAIGYLDALDLVRRERDHRRRERYVVDDDLWLRTWKTDAERHRRWADTAERGADIFGPATPTGARFDIMNRFFTRLAGEMDGGPLTADAVADALSVLAALAFAGAPLTVEQLAGALGWPSDRLGRALQDVELYPDIADPITVEHADIDVYTVAVRRDRLSATQRQFLRSLRPRAGLPLVEDSRSGARRGPH